MARITRRKFHAAALGAASLFAAPAILRGRNLNEKLNIAIIGAGGRGGANLHEVGSENIVVLCDVNQAALDAAHEKHPSARQFRDFRKVFDDPAAFDAVVVSTCEHTHAFATMLALKHGKHVYCEKPLTHGIWEARQIREAAATAGVATQMGIQIHATENYRQVVELIQAGAIGPVSEAHVWTSRAWGWQSPEDAARHHDIVSTQDRPAGADPIPAELDWDLWLGPAPERPFSNVYFPGPKWYRWWDFGSGTMSDLGSHWNDLPFWALRLRTPLRISADGPPPHPELAPASMSATY
ncbi:MAG: Gfo/Idh/MocA family oxidoreductase, partial [Planctomycetaceae bacterium]|nr:Gfo/Idh/MocA family oxidoreductase [Planctomycetaceae bacterium]